MTHNNYHRQSVNYCSDVVSMTVLDGGTNSAFLCLSPQSREGDSEKPKRLDGDANRNADKVETFSDIESRMLSEVSEEANELKIHCQNAPVLSPEAFTVQARRMDQARSTLVQLLIGSNCGLMVMAEEFLNRLADGVDLSELINKNSSDSNVPVQNGHFVQDTAKQLEIKLVTCFHQVLDEQESNGECETLAECRLFLAQMHFLPNFLQQVVGTIVRRSVHEAFDIDDGQWLSAIEDQRHRMIASRQAMINGNLRLVTFIAKQFNNQALSFSDLIQDGTVGLIKAVDRYDWSRAVRFSTYAIYWIRQTITRAMARQEKMVRLPYNVAAKASAVFEIMNNYLMQNNKWPSTSELAELCTLPEDEVKAIVENYQPIISLDSNINDDDNMPEMIATIEQCHFPQPLNCLVNSALKSFLRRAVGTLPEREADIINCRFGLLNDHEMTLQDIADKMSLTRERVRQIQNSALVKLKNNFSGELVDFLEPG